MIESDTSMEKNSGPRDELTRILDEIDQWIAPIEAETNRAVDFAKTNKRGGHFIALTGAQEASQMPLVANSELFGIFPVDYPPGLVNLTAALAPHCRSEYARLGSATGSVKHELWITGSASKQVAFQMANSIVYLLRITGDWSARAVGYADTSWSAIAGQKSSVIAQVVGEEWHQKERFGSQTVSFADLDWVDHHLVHTLRLRKTENFRLAFDAAGTVHLVADLRTK